MSSDRLQQIVEAGIKAVSPGIVFPKLLQDPPYPELQDWLQSSDRHLLCIGKAAIASAESILATSDCRDLFVLSPGEMESRTIPASRIFAGSHPVPDELSLAAAAALLVWIDSLPENASLLVVLSGGASSLMAMPAEGIALESKRSLNQILLRSGASIQEMNVVRKHCSGVKGGRLAQRVERLKCMVLVISDVIGDDLSVIGSGPFYPDPSTFLEARTVLEKYSVWSEIPNDVRQHLELGVSGAVAETPKPGSRTPRHEIVASNLLARQAAATRATELGYNAVVVPDPIDGPVEQAAQRLNELAKTMAPNSALILGGEVTVRIPAAASGTGGRNQHLALLMTKQIAGGSVLFSAVGTDGIDGNSPAAGAWTDGATMDRARNASLDIRESIETFDSYPFFRQLAQSIQTGPTGTNVMDLYVALSGKV